MTEEIVLMIYAVVAVIVFVAGVTVQGFKRAKAEAKGDERELRWLKDSADMEIFGFFLFAIAWPLMLCGAVVLAPIALLIFAIRSFGGWLWKVRGRAT